MSTDSTTKVEKVVTSGSFKLDGGTWDVDNNVWLVGDGHHVLVIDAAHNPGPIHAAIGDRTVTGIVLTHGHNDHINAAMKLRRLTGAPIWLNPADRMLWDEVYGHDDPDKDLHDGVDFGVADVDLHAIATPGHSPGSTCLYAPSLGMLFSGDTLFNGGPGATGRSYSSRPEILKSIRSALLSLPPETVVHTGHGDDTTIGAEQADSAGWSETDD